MKETAERPEVPKVKRMKEREMKTRSDRWADDHADHLGNDKEFFF